jgi:type IV pilus assembly protein PilM
MNLPEFFGLDIGNHSIKVAQCNPGSKPELKAIGHIETDSNITTIDDENSKNMLAEKIKQVKEASGITTKSVIAALPEAAIFTRLILLPDLPEDQIEQSLFYEARQYLPIPPSDVQLDYLKIAKKTVDNKNMVQALLVAAPKTVVNKYMDVISRAGLELIAMETETMATTRAITHNQQLDGSTLIIDFGANGTDLSVVKGQYPIFSQSLATGSDALTKAIASDFGLEYSQAEQYKRTYGLLPEQADGKIAKSLYPVMQIIINEINKTLNYFRAHLQESTPKKIFIVGDGAKLPGLGEYLSKSLGIPSEVTDPILGLNVNPRIKSEVAQLSTVGFTVAIGLALKSE